MKNARLVTASLALIGLCVTAAFATEGVSPGALDRMAQVNNACPTFSWGMTNDAIAYDLVAYLIPEDTSIQAELTADSEVLFTRVAGSATSWTPSADQCFEPGGAYVWFVRSVRELAGDEVAAASEWSAARYFTVPAAPSIDEVARALEVLQRYVAQGGDTQVLASASAPSSGGHSTAPLKGGDLGGTKSVPTASAAIRGEHPSLTGEAYGVVGVSSAEDGAGVAAAHLDGGPDLVLDGSVDGEVDTKIWEWGLDRSSAGARTFTLGNSGGGGFTLQVEGAISGDGSLLTGISATDADTLDGQHGRFYQDADNLIHGTLSADRFSAYSDLLAEGYLGNSPGDVALNNTARQGDLNADLLDGQHGAFYLDAANLVGGPLSDTVFSAYGNLGREGHLDNADDLDLPTRLQADGRFVNTDGDLMSGMLRMENDGIELALTATAADEATANVAKLQMRSSASLTVFRLDSEGDVSATSFSGDGSGLTGIASDDIECPGCVETDDLADAAVTAMKIATGAVTGTRIADGSVSGSKISTNAVTGDKVADGAIDTADLASGAVTGAKIAVGTITSAAIMDGNVTEADLAANAVTTAKIANGTVAADDLATAAVTLTKIQDGAVAGSKLAAAAVTEQKIAPAAVTNAKLATGAVTAAKVASAEVQLRVSGQCAVGSAVRTIASDGSVTCEEAGGGDLTPPVSIDGTNNVYPILSVSNGGVRPAIAGVSAGSSGVSGRSDSEGDAGVDGSATAIGGLGVKGAASGGNGIALYGEATGDGGTGVEGLGFSLGGRFESTGLSGGIGIIAKGGSSGQAAVFMGNVAVKDRNTGELLIELGKGLDYAEGFDVSDAEPLEAGTVLVIDPSAPGELARSRQPYDTRVAGIIAGANGLGSGVRLGAGGFDHDVALAGRVYCKVDATEHGIEPGDLLTTAALPGHAMKATEFDRARGAVLGKAMEPLEAGITGQILVLVSLQ